METETYKNAKLILERFDTDSKKKMVRFVLLYKYIIKAILNSVFDWFVVCLQEFESTLVGPQLTPKPGQGNTKF